MSVELHLSVEEERARSLARIASEKSYLRGLDDLRQRFSRAVDAEYVYAKILLRREKGIKAIPTGVGWWDDWVGPFRRANLYCIAGYQGGGKSTLAVNLTWNMAKSGMKVWNFCLELTAEETFELVAGHVLGKTEMSPEDEAEAYAIIQSSGYRFFEPSRDATWRESIDLICDTVRKEQIDFVIIDNFSYLTSTDHNSYETERVAAKALKGLSQELEIPILVIAHLRKPDRDDSEPSPTAHSVLGSGAITQVASDAFILHHPLTGDEDQSRHQVGYVLSGKPRWGKGGKRYVRLDGSKRLYVPATRDEYPKKAKNRRNDF